MKRLSGILLGALLMFNFASACGGKDGDGNEGLLFFLLSSAGSSLNASWAAAPAEATTGASEYRGSAVDSAGNVYIVTYGGISGTYDFGNSVQASFNVAYANTSLLVKYNASGVAQWATTVCGASVSLSDVAADSAGNVYVVGTVTGNTALNCGNGVTLQGPSAFPSHGVLIKYDSNGAAQWARTLATGPDDSSFNALAVDSAGAIYVVGSVVGTGTYNFGNSVTVTGEVPDTGGPSYGHGVLLVKYSSAGVAQLARTLADTGFDDASFTDVALDSSGNIYAAGNVDSALPFNFGNGVTVSGDANDSNALLVKYNSAGTAQWARSTESGETSTAFSSVAVDASGAVYVGGWLNGGAAVGLGNSVSPQGAYAGGLNALVVKYDASGSPVWAKTTTESSASTDIRAIGLDAGGSLFAAGAAYDNNSVSFGNNASVTTQCTGCYSPLLLKYDGSGNAAVAKSGDGYDFSYFTTLSVDPSGAVYAGGTIRGAGSYTFDNVSVEAVYSGVNGVLVRYN
ncbi:hypothetical protein [Leptonema illini]|uniref:Beta-propeller repeat-containing protein n=1 Tax=Leptonema illini DSM 21528 TaxID=929563 RepID=H2CGH8_9LEPT|nr:hypothetical protein [Leptonema illini]EHQ07895.1 hypothetical protein Lepil_3233 [Leptonema illini DSM 21528]